RQASLRVKRSTLSTDERAKVEGMREILAEVWSPFQTLEGAINELETDAAPALELEFWDTLAEAFLCYFGQAIILKARQYSMSWYCMHRQALTLPKSGMQDDGKKSLTGFRKEAFFPRSDVRTLTHHLVQKDTSASSATESSNADDPAASPAGGVGVLEASSASKESVVVTQQGEEGDGGEELGDATADRDGHEMLPMKDVPHLTRHDRLHIIRATAPLEKRQLVLQRLFYVAQ
ncbi:unnamed protein product, partial [Choristocarpus tenellus]